ncbi:hypothetical protein [Pseudomonas aeruginosa]|uniref:Uncharacterized protein n=2 Tax=Nankokuvirus TaxID=1925779 RepID=A0A218L3U7_9CAUD|nr:hypothetical protein [Pseudomonas aeruginosa]YP_004306744.1 hypothetical protein KPP10_gp151 [Pseudomonas phage KPP10]YP_009604672.1 hypothetical protein FDH93_gp045 [Pseudomonas phage vB_PaeM_G1]ARW57312.1 hypothetical protein vBPaeMG1_045 [Pseudomonas phage vB_PaeM_G1]BAJ09114.1 hypothetical protein [Pseudomonas phage KPP10]
MSVKPAYPADRKRIRVVEQNPISFLQAVENAIAEGYRVENTLAGFPVVSSASGVRTITLFHEEVCGPTEVASPEAVKSLSENAVEVKDYNLMNFLLAFQSQVLAGYTLDTSRVSMLSSSLHWAVLEKGQDENVVFDFGSSEPEVESQPEAESQATEKPARKKRQPKPKPKQQDEAEQEQIEKGENE